LIQEGNCWLDEAVKRFILKLACALFFFPPCIGKLKAEIHEVYFEELGVIVKVATYEISAQNCSLICARERDTVLVHNNLRSSSPVR